MKCLGLSLPLASATLFLVGTSLGQVVATTPMTGAGAEAISRSAELLRRFDANGDGRIDEDERAEAKAGMIRDQVSQQMARTAAAQAKPEQFRTHARELFDRDRNGRFDDAERAAARAFFEERGKDSADATAAAYRDELIRRFDKNGNGRLEPEERTGLRELWFGAAAGTDVPDGTAAGELEAVIRGAIEANARQAARFDADKNGKLDAVEWRAAREEIARSLARSADVNAAKGAPPSDSQTSGGRENAGMSEKRDG